MQISEIPDPGFELLAPARRVEVEVVHRAFVCSDVVAFSRMTERLGDEKALEVMRRVSRIVRATTSVHGGSELEVRGDCFLLAFSSIERALDCAVTIQRSIESDRIAHSGEGVELRSSVHAGNVVLDGDGYFGRNVILAFRLLDRAAPGEVVASAAVRDRVDGRWSRCFGAERTFRPKGFRDEERFVHVRTSEPAIPIPGLGFAQPVPTPGLGSSSPCDA